MQKLHAIKKDVLVTDMDFDEQVTSYGLIIPSDDGKSHGIKPRWGKVFAVGPDQTEYKVGQWVLVEHGRWSRKIKLTVNDEVIKFQKVELESIIAVKNDEPSKDDLFYGSL
jgi:co-chaperonin GroES (HSP10)